MTLISAQVEEFEQGAWVAEIVALESFSGSFTLFDGSTWTGTKVAERSEHAKFYTTVIGGQGHLGASVQDKYYAGNVALSIALSDLCNEGGETPGQATPGLFLSTYQRQAGTLAEALDGMADAFGQIWWIDRTGTLQMNTARPVGQEATGDRVSSDTDASAVLVNPQNLTLGSSYAVSDSGATMQTIRHIRWSQTPQRFSAQIYPVPFLYRPPVQTKYDRHYQAIVQVDNGDGTVDVIADNGRFGVTKVPLLCGVPGSKVKTKPNEVVTLGFFGGNPQKPYAVAMQQNTAATKQVARNTDPVKVTISVSNGKLAALAAMITAPPGGGGPCTATPGLIPPADSLDLTGTITQGSNRLMVDDG